MKIGDKLVRLREQAGISQSELARQVGIAQSTLSELESNMNGPSSSSLCKLAAFFKCSTNYLLGMDEKPA